MAGPQHMLSQRQNVSVALPGQTHHSPPRPQSSPQHPTKFSPPSSGPISFPSPPLTLCTVSTEARRSAWVTYQSGTPPLLFPALPARFTSASASSPSPLCRVARSSVSSSLYSRTRGRPRNCSPSRRNRCRFIRRCARFWVRRCLLLRRVFLSVDSQRGRREGREGEGKEGGLTLVVSDDLIKVERSFLRKAVLVEKVGPDDHSVHGRCPWRKGGRSRPLCLFISALVGRW